MKKLLFTLLFIPLFCDSQNIFVSYSCGSVPDQPSVIIGTNPVCQGNSGVVYSVTNVAGVTYTWTYSGTGYSQASGGTSNSITADYSPGATTGTLTVTPSNACGNGPSQTYDVMMIQYLNTAQSGNYTKNDCGACETGSTETYTVPANTYSSCTSQGAANALAANDVSTNGQAYANSIGSCTVGIQYLNTVQSGNYTKNDCGACETGSIETYTVPANTYSSCISQGAANALAANDVSTNGQAYANSIGSCTVGIQYLNDSQSGNYTKNDCGACETGSTETYTVPANTYSSCISQVAANALAANDVSANGQAYANSNGSCSGTQYWNTAQSGNYTRNNCCGTGSTVTYTVPANTYSSCTSQDAANALAANDVSTNGQAYANSNGSCTNGSVAVFTVDAGCSGTTFVANYTVTTAGWGVVLNSNGTCGGTYSATYLMSSGDTFTASYPNHSSCGGAGGACGSASFDPWSGAAPIAICP